MGRGREGKGKKREKRKWGGGTRREVGVDERRKGVREGGKVKRAWFVLALTSHCPIPFRCMHGLAQVDL